MKRTPANLSLQVGCSRCARPPDVLLCILHGARRGRDDVYVFTRARSVLAAAGCDVYIYTWRITRFVTARRGCQRCSRCRSARAVSPSRSVSTFFILNNLSLNLLFFCPLIGHIFPHIFPHVLYLSVHSYMRVHSILYLLFYRSTHLQLDISDYEWHYRIV